MSLRILVWNENVHETRGDATVLGHYPHGIHTAIADGLRELLPDARVETATLADPEHGLSQERLDDTDVLLWWGHIAHDEVSDEVVDRVQRSVQAGMGLVVLHSGHFAKPFIRLLGTTCSLGWRNDGDQERVWTVDPGHPIAADVPPRFTIPAQEVYSEYFDIPKPDDVIFLSTFAGGEVFRSGVTFTRGRGRIFYFSPGDQEYPVYHQPEVRRVLANGARWVAPVNGRALPEVVALQRGWLEEDAGR
ncbi:trehalose utilization protein ThuA [Arenivirga flava]|uniref:Trehalose utilization protein ThuA n=1 Tax=Arenivirga flava TaxID=1930060 RepID=A0AA37XB92_9MICO|nr:trehalose utilization protein ThuA [Arenivirga flava]